VRHGVPKGTNNNTKLPKKGIIQANPQHRAAKKKDEGKPGGKRQAANLKYTAEFKSLMNKTGNE